MRPRSKRQDTKPARQWRQIRINPEEERLIYEIAARTGLSVTTVARQLIRKALGLSSAGL